jgi:hypothetical protein
MSLVTPSSKRFSTLSAILFSVDLPAQASQELGPYRIFSVLVHIASVSVPFRSTYVVGLLISDLEHIYQN